MKTRCLLPLAIAASAVLHAATIAPAAVTYQAVNHPDAYGIENNDVEATGYVLRLDMGLQKHTFNANTIGDLVLTIDSANNQLILAGHVTHNQSGLNTTAADADDDVYLLHAVFSLPSLTDATPSDPWYGTNDVDAVYDQVLDDLLADATPYESGQTSTSYSLSATRLSFFMVELTLTPDAANQHLGETFPQDRLVWDEFPDDQSRPLLIEYDWRVPGADALAGGGSVETDPGGLRYGASELIFVLDPQSDSTVPPVASIPVPEALPLGLIGVTLIVLARRRFGF